MKDLKMKDIKLNSFNDLKVKYFKQNSQILFVLKFLIWCSFESYNQ